MKQAIVIGGGAAGLSAAASLSAKGWNVTLLEKTDRLGGGFRSVRLGSYHFDLGFFPVTMPWMIERVYREAGTFMDPTLTFQPLDVCSRHFFQDGTWLDVSADPDRMGRELEKLSPEDRREFLEYLNEVGRMYEAVEEHFLERPAGAWSDLLSVKAFKAWWSVHPFESADAFHRRYFDDPRLVAVLNRYAAGVGSSPFDVPATVSLISYLDMVQGACAVQGGHDVLIASMESLVRSRGVRIETSCPMEGLLVEEGRVTGVRAGGEVWKADAVLLAEDPGSGSVLPPEVTDALLDTPRISAFVMLLGVARTFPHLHHHNLFYQDLAGREYIELFDQREWPRSPVIYVGHPGFSEPDRAPEGKSALCVMVHVPAGMNDSGSDDLAFHREWLLDLLESGWGFLGLRESIEEEMILGPRELEELTGAPDGALYGPAAHGWRTFARLPARNRKVTGLYHAGPWVCPGGISLSAVSGLHAAHIMHRDAEEAGIEREAVKTGS
ncbi:phytoene desaturase family protein [Staphylospora marina]|uniref:phytoene desaturase family protein n=1 Tax=Staphylospora marina TaxID=2490858 RepID=UPI000F5BC5EB|nr:NAD(P)/FAD-dependent oxidoreductase [Staphylospora marina]